MIGVIVSKELRTLSRNRVLLGFTLAITALMFVAALMGQARVDAFDRERADAAATDRAVWLAQGERNPHSAAHFSRYAFKPIPALALFDPGSLDYAGIALWMEAHNQNPAVYRRAEDRSDLQLFAELSPAWILQVFGPLIVFCAMFAAMAGEREDGTLRQLLSIGVSPRSIMVGKVVGGIVALLLIFSPGLLLSLPLVSQSASVVPTADQSFRVLSIAGAYLMTLAIYVLLALGVSSLAKSRRSAFLALLVIWGASVIAVPRIAGDVAATLHPQPEAREIRRTLSQAAGAYRQATDLRERELAELLERYNVASETDLPVSYAAFSLQRSEEVAHPLFEKIYGDLADNHGRQDTVLGWFSAASPTLALARLSAGLAGVDRFHHEHFVWAAETHRRKIVKQMNDDMFEHAAGTDGRYLSSADFWETIDDFPYRPPAFSAFRHEYAAAAFALSLQLLLALGFATWAMGRSQKLERAG
ncbi:MAG: ABC transporter permease subunit [Pseudomonadota bacterium]